MFAVESNPLLCSKPLPAGVDIDFEGSQPTGTVFLQVGGLTHVANSKRRRGKKDRTKLKTRSMERVAFLCERCISDRHRKTKVIILWLSRPVRLSTIAM